VCWSAVWCVAVCCSVLQCVAVITTLMRYTSIRVCTSRDMCPLLKRRVLLYWTHTSLPSPPEEGQNFCQPFKHQFFKSKPTVEWQVIDTFFFFIYLFWGIWESVCIWSRECVIDTLFFFIYLFRGICESWYIYFGVYECVSGVESVS